MNIFFLDISPMKCAEYHCDKHVVKMILETAQLLSTAHRVLDGTKKEITDPDTKRKRTIWELDDPMLNCRLYAATHINHPSSKWVRESSTNYVWLLALLRALNNEYTYRYGKVHKVVRSGLQGLLDKRPDNIPVVGNITVPPCAMPDHCLVYRKDGKPNVVESYRNYYNLEKQRMLKWKNRHVPWWVNIEQWEL